ncbi:DUF2478 domain-containing protein [Aurantimonas sp. VKM B-3413]|uniref:DUF2478 domain-containing protein n=1 Tax=Aurantimonas sp. VKM B-3413 TaxID=2779401 RepID=UPI001E46A465|nr:DUF2478 domain-containing protein [Aurantimonas sp. VKM B-3413]MCB8836317.1 DUF2478 domain-containing protein [Aurantimonas sp. VKM B-3413]
MTPDPASAPITAIVYADGAAFEAFLKDAAYRMTAAGLRLAGLVQHSEARPGRAKCDMYLQDLATGRLAGISEDRGPEARGCVLDTDRLARICEAAETALSADTDLLVLCKFGKTEAEGGGFRGLIARALDLDVPVVIGVPRVNLEPFRAFAADLAREIDAADVTPGALAGLARYPADA